MKFSRMYIGALAVAGMALAYAGTVTTPFADVDGPGVRRDGDRAVVSRIRVPICERQALHDGQEIL